MENRDVPIEHKTGDLTTFRNVSEATKTAISILALCRKKPQGEVITEVVDAYVKKLLAEGDLPDVWANRLVVRMAADAAALEARRARRRNRMSRSEAASTTSPILASSSTSIDAVDEAARCNTPSNDISPT